MNKKDYRLQFGDFQPIVEIDKYRERTDSYIIDTLNNNWWEKPGEVLRPVLRRKFGLILYNSLFIVAPVVAGFLSSGLENLTN